MFEALILAIISGFVGYGFNRIMEPDMIAHPYKRLLSRLSRINQFLNYITKPLGLCIYCNTAWIGFILAYYTDCDLFWIITIGVCSVGIVAIINFHSIILQEKLKLMDTMKEDRNVKTKFKTFEGIAT